MASEKGKPAQKNERGGKKLGGDEHPTFAWGGNKEAGGSSVSGKLLELNEVKTRFGVRARFSLLTNEPLVCEAQDTGEIVNVPAGKTVGMWLPERWATAMRGSLNQTIEIFRDIEGTQVRYDVRQR